MFMLHVPPAPPQQGSLAKPHSHRLVVPLHVRFTPHGFPRQQGCWLLPHALHIPVVLLQPCPLGHTGHAIPELAVPLPPLVEPVAAPLVEPAAAPLVEPVAAPLVEPAAAPDPPLAAPVPAPEPLAVTVP